MKAKKLLAVLLSLAMIMTMFPVVVFGADEPSDLLPTYQFDFGMTSTPVMAGWTPVTINAQKNPSEASSTMYSAESGYGFLSPISSLISRDRSSGNTYGANQMERDWVGSKDWKFQADVKPGTYNIIVYCTDIDVYKRQAASCAPRPRTPTGATGWISSGSYLVLSNSYREKHPYKNKRRKEAAGH